MKKIVLMVTVIMLLCNAFTVFSAPLFLPELSGAIILKVGINKAVVDNAPGVLDSDENVVPFIENGRTLVPLRFIAEAFKSEVDWDDNTKVITITNGETKVFFQIDNNIMYVSGTEVELETPPNIYFDKTYVPLRAIAEALGKNVNYEDGWIIITKSNMNWDNVIAENKETVYNAILKDRYIEKIETTIIDFDSSEYSFYKYNPISAYSFMKDNTISLASEILTMSSIEKFQKLLKDNNIKIKRFDQPLFLTDTDVLYCIDGGNKKNITFEEVAVNVADFSVGDRFAVILKKDGTFLTKTYLESETPIKSENIIPVLDEGLDFRVDNRVLHGRTAKNLKGEARAVFAGRECVFYIKHDGTLWAYGSNHKGKLGDGTTNDHTADEPVEIKGVPNPQFIAAANSHTLCIDKDGNLWAWGENSTYELSNELGATTLTPKKLTGIDNVKYVTTAYGYTIAVKKDGTVWAVGDNDRGRLGIANIRKVTEFTQIPGLSDIVYVKASNYHYLTGNSSAVNVDGELYTWGTAKPTKTPSYTNIGGAKPVKFGAKLDLNYILYK